jgi:hypothetical protein
MGYEMTPERKFSLYAIPALENCAKDKITDEEKSQLTKLVVEGGAPSRKTLEKLFPTAFKRMRTNLGVDFWSVEKVEKYWWDIHNTLVREDCHVKFVEVTKEEDDRAFVGVKNIKEPEIKYAINYLGYKLKPGDFIAIHKGRISEIVSEEIYLRYGQ